jgi:hypothetical protein
MKVNLETGKWDWRKTNLSRTGPAGEYRINAFELPRPDGDAMIFPEAPLDQAAPGRVILKKADGSIISVE